MTEEEWLESADASEMLFEFWRDKASERKLRLFMCAYLRRASGATHLLAAVETTEQFVDGTAAQEQFKQAWEMGWGCPVGTLDPWGLALGAADVKSDPVGQPHLLRDIFGNPFRPVTLDPAWRTATVLSLGQAIYD